MTENYTFSVVMIAIAGVFCLITLVYVLRRAFGRQAGETCGWELRGARQRIAAVARTTMAEGLRAKIASGFALVILVAVPLFYLTAEGDGTIKGRVQMFVMYAMGFAGFVLSLLTIFFACRSLSIEIASRQVYAIATKPIPRWQILAGKWTGIMIFNTVLLAIVTLATYAGTILIIRGFKTHLASDLQNYGGLTGPQAAQAVSSLDQVSGVGKTGADSPIITAFASALGRPPQQIADLLLQLPEPTRVDLRKFDQLRRQVLVARAVVAPDPPDLGAETDRVFNQLKEDDRLPEDMTEREVRERVADAVFVSYHSIAMGDTRTWRFQRLTPKADRDFILTVRFKIHVPAQLPPMSFRGGMLEEDKLLCLWGIGDPSKPTFAEYEDAFPARTFNEFEIPVNAIAPDGTLLVHFLNADPRRGIAVFDMPGALEVLYRIGPFELGLLQAALAILIPISCLASFGICASTFLSLPVGSLIVLTMFILSISMGFVAESFAATEEYVGPNPGLDFQVRRSAVKSVEWALYIGDVDPVSQLIEGRAVGWTTLWNAFWKQGLLKSAAVMVVAVLVLRRRELAAVIV